MAGLTRVGVFGGTFDPPHYGHLVLAAEAHHQLQLDQVLWVLTPKPPHKRENQITPVAKRLAMLQAALAGNPAFKISTVDLDRPPPHYAVDTMHYLREDYPKATLYYLMGADSLKDLPTWYSPGEFLESIDYFGVIQRPGKRSDLTDLELQLPGLASKVQIVDAPLLEISSTDIRARIRDGRPYQYYILPAVYEIIRKNGLYVD